MSSTYATPSLTTSDDGAAYRVMVFSGATVVFSSEASVSVIGIGVTPIVYNFAADDLGGGQVFGWAVPTNGALLLDRPAGGSYGAFLLPNLTPDSLVRGFTAAFKVQIAAGNGYADGFSFNWATNLPQGVYPMAEEGEGSGLRVCFDIFDNGNEAPAIDVKWGTNLIASYRTNVEFLVGTESEPESSVVIRLNPNGTLDVIYRCVPIFVGLPLPGYTPLVNARFGLGARTGAVYSKYTIDDLTIALKNSILDQSSPGDAVVGSSLNSPVMETAPKAIDNDVTSKYLNVDKLNAGLTITPLGQQPVRALTLISAEDAPERDPSSYVLEGSTNGVVFIPLASNSVPLFPTRQFIQSFAITNTNPFSTYRLRFPTVANSATANSMQIAEVELLNYPEITAPNDTLSIALPPGAVDVRGVAALFDRQLGAVRKLEVAPITNSSTIVNVKLSAGASVLKGFELIGAADDVTYPQRRPSFVTVAGSADGISYTNLTTVIPAAPSSNLQIQEFATASNTVAFASYRITLGPPVGGDRIQVGEMRLFGETVPSVEPRPVLSIRSSSGSVFVSWTNAAGFVLQSNSQLANTNWVSVGIAPTLSNGVNTVQLPGAGDASFFRLRK